MENYDIIIIGAGLGGLVAGAKLAKEGRKVFFSRTALYSGGLPDQF